MESIRGMMAVLMRTRSLRMTVEEPQGTRRAAALRKMESQSEAVDASVFDASDPSCAKPFGVQVPGPKNGRLWQSMVPSELTDIARRAHPMATSAV